LKEFQVKLADLRREFAEYNSTYTPAHYKVKRVKAQIDEIEKTIHAERTHVLQRIRNEHESAVLRERMLEADYAAQSGLVTAQAGKSVEYRILEREAATNRTLYDNLLQKVKEAGVAAAMAASNVRVIDPATTPSRPIRPNHVLNGGLGFASGALLGLLLIFIRERSDHTLRQPGDAALFLGLPELGVIPDGDGERKERHRAGRFPERGEILQIAGAASSADPDRAPHGDNVELATWQRRPSLIAECFRATLTSILFAGGADNRPRVLVVTSASPGEGKTTVASNLAIALAEINRRVLLIDADMRKPRLHKVFGVSNLSGLSNLLRERNPLNGTPLAGVVQATGIPDLFVLSSGPGAVSIPNLLHSERMAELLEKARGEFDTILIDSPPMLPIADARILARSADAVVLVLQAGRTSRDSARAVVNRFSEDGSVILGAVLNSWTPSGREYGDYYEYTAYARAS
jgi:capsular exopolysaccharide synthesis family protein